MPDLDVKVLLDFQEVAERLGVRYILVGAGSRQLAVRQKRLEGQTVLDLRATMDWDFGVQLENHAAYEAVKAALTEGKFKKEKAWQRFVHVETGVVLDLVPFGGIAFEGQLEIQNGEVSLQVLGFDEALENALFVDVDGGTIPIVNDIGFMILKLIAWKNRRKHDDLRDLWHVLQHYDSSENMHRAFEQFGSLVGEQVVMEHIIARLLGADMGAVMASNTRQAVEEILSGLADMETLMVKSIARFGQPLEEIANLFAQVLEGVRHSPHANCL